METEPIQLWGGVECTVNRVGDRHFNQLELSGHWHREADLERFAELGIRTLRFPLLWETLAPQSLDHIDWSWADARLAKLKALGIRPIVGLLHHGSGPAYTSLIDPAFPEKLSRFAALIARRYPWVDAYTPIRRCGDLCGGSVFAQPTSNFSRRSRVHRAFLALTITSPASVTLTKLSNTIRKSCTATMVVICTRMTRPSVLVQSVWLGRK